MHSYLYTAVFIAFNSSFISKNRLIIQKQNFVCWILEKTHEKEILHAKFANNEIKFKSRVQNLKIMTLKRNLACKILQSTHKN